MRSEYALIALFAVLGILLLWGLTPSGRRWGGMVAAFLGGAIVLAITAWFAWVDVQLLLAGTQTDGTVTAVVESGRRCGITVSFVDAAGQPQSRRSSLSCRRAAEFRVGDNVTVYFDARAAKPWPELVSDGPRLAGIFAVAVCLFVVGYLQLRYQRRRRAAQLKEPSRPGLESV